MSAQLSLSRPGAALPAAGEADLRLPDLDLATFFSGAIGGRALLSLGLIVCVLGLAFGFLAYRQLQNLPVHPSMREISELIYETCKAYLIQQGKFLLILWAFIAAVIVVYFGVPRRTSASGPRRDRPGVQPHRHGRLVRRRLVRHPRQHVRQLPHRVRLAARQAPTRCTRSR